MNIVSPIDSINLEVGTRGVKTTEALEQAESRPSHLAAACLSKTAPTSSPTSPPLSAQTVGAARSYISHSNSTHNCSAANPLIPPLAEPRREKKCSPFFTGTIVSTSIPRDDLSSWSYLARHSYQAIRVADLIVEVVVALIHRCRCLGGGCCGGRPFLCRRRGSPAL